MPSLLKNLFLKIKKINKCLTLSTKENKPKHSYKVVSIESDEHSNYIAVIQITNKNCIFKMKPEEILADNKITDCFSQRDIRTLTYLGYLGINSPKYKILAKRLSENDSKLLFAIQERGKKGSIVRTAHEISADETIISGLHQKEAHMIGYSAAQASILIEKKQKEKLLNEKLKIVKHGNFI